MLRLGLVLLFAACVYGNAADFEANWMDRIVGGQNAGTNQFPHQASLRSAGNFHFCGASVINNRWALSAAHCTVGRTLANTRVIVGTNFLNSGGIAHTVSAIVNHPQYNANLISNDVSVVQTATTITFTPSVQPIGMGTAFVGGGTSATASGWGQTSHPGSAPNALQFITTNTLTNAVCRSLHTVGNAQFVLDSTLCSFTGAGQGICMGDSGGPLTSGGNVIGIASWVIPCAVGRPDAWARMSSFRPWVLSVI